MKKIWAPWRLAFIVGSKKKIPAGKKARCVFCAAEKEKSSSKNFVLFKTQRAFVILNRYPYSNGHLMVLPRRHIGDFLQLDSREHEEMTRLVRLSLKALRRALKAQGFNIGMNLGAVAGAGIRDHLHYHIVPRWFGDHNYMPVLADLRVLPEHLKDTYLKLKRYF